MLKDMKARTKYFDNVGHRDKEKLKDGYSLLQTPGAVAVYSEGPTKPSHKWKRNGPNQVNTISRSKGSDGFTIYKQGPAPAAPAPAPAPAPPPKPQPKPSEPIKHSPEIEQAKERVSSYEKDILSGKTSEDIYGKSQATVQSSSGNPSEDIYGKAKATVQSSSSKPNEDIYGQAQSTVQSSFIKPTSFNFNKQIDFSANTFEAKASSEPNEQAQADQTQLQDFISKYSSFKSSTN